MKHHLLALGVMLSLTSIQSDAMEIYGYQTWEPMSDTPYRGPIHFSSSNPADATHIADCSDMGVVYGGYYYNYHWYGQAIVKGTSSSVDGLYEIDMNTGERTLIAKGGAKLIDMTYDYSTGKVFGIRSGNVWLAEFNTETGESTLVGKFTDGTEEVYMLAIAASLDGTLYGVSSSDKFYKIDPENGTLTLIGALGADAAFDQTMAFDYSDGTLYWANNGDYQLYTIDVATGAATPIGPIGKNGLSSMGSLFIPYINVAAGAPDRVTGAKATGGTTSATLSWTYPAITAQGAPLTDLDGVVITRNGEEIQQITASADLIGKEGIYVDEDLTPETVYSYEIIPYNSAGRGGCDSRKLTVRVGRDLPGAVEQLKVTDGDGKAILSWLAPTAGASGGVFDPSDITGYEIIRDEAVIANVAATQLTYEDEAPFGRHSYTVTPVTAFGAGTPTTVENILVKPAGWVVMTEGEAKLEPGKEYKFYDEGGPDANYLNSRKYTLVVSPSVEDAFVSVDFTSFCVETYGDYLSIYDGRGIEGRLIGKYAATSLPAELAHIESSTADGCLTFVFYSDLIESAPGWEADIKAIRRLGHDLEVSSLKVPNIAVAETACGYQVSVRNKGTNPAGAYSIVLLDGDKELTSVAGPALEPSSSADLTIEYTPGTEGDMAVSAKIVYDADNDLTNNTSAVFTQKVLPKGSEFIDLFAPEDQISNLYVIPASFFGFESISQILLPAEAIEAGENLRLSAVSFPLGICTSSYTQVPLRVWVGETDLTDLTEGSIPASQLTETFNGLVDIQSGQESLDFTLSGQYPYTGRNLVIMVHKQYSATNNSGVAFRGSYGYDGRHENCSRFDSHSFEEDPAFDPEVSFGYSAQNMRPDMRLIFSPEQSGIDSAVADNSAFVTVNGREITAAVPFNVFTPAGAMVASCSAYEKRVLPAGIYIVTSESSCSKVTIR